MRECGCQCGHERGVCHTDWTRDGREFGGGVTVKRDLSTQTTAIRITIRTTQTRYAAYCYCRIVTLGYITDTAQHSDATGQRTRVSSSTYITIQVQFLNIIRDNARKGPVKVHFNKSLKFRPLLDIGKSVLKS